METSTEKPRLQRTLERALVGVGFGALCLGTGALGALSTRGRGSPDGAWYRSLTKPRFQPPAAVFAPVWTILYAAIAYSGYRAWRAPSSPDRTRALALFAAQLSLNAAWSPLFFGARRPRVALLDLVGLDLAAAAYARSVARVDRRAAIAVAPYLAWIGFATYLNAGIVRRNPTSERTAST